MTLREAIAEMEGLMTNDLTAHETEAIETLVALAERTLRQQAKSITRSKILRQAARKYMQEHPDEFTN